MVDETDVLFGYLVLLKTPAQGALTQIWAATSKDVKTGKYYVPVAKENRRSGYSNDKNLALELWDWTEKVLQSMVTKHGENCFVSAWNLVIFGSGGVSNQCLANSFINVHYLPDRAGSR